MYISGCVSKRENQGLFENQIKGVVTNVENVPMSLKPYSHFSWNNPYLERFYLGIQEGPADMNNVFGLTPTFVTWDSKVISTRRLFWEHQRSDNLKKGVPILLSFAQILMQTILA